MLRKKPKIADFIASFGFGPCKVEVLSEKCGRLLGEV
jgi:hypothetical protein